MPTNGPLHTPFDNPLVSTPGGGESTMRGEGVTLPAGDGKQGLTGTPFEHPIMPVTQSQAPTGNTSEIPADWLTVKGIPDAPAPGTTASVADGVATPNTPVGNMTGGNDPATRIGVGKS